MDPDVSRAQLIMAAYVEKGRFAEALAQVNLHGRSVSAPWYWEYLAKIHGRAGRQIQAQHALDELLGLHRRKPIDAIVFADAYAGLGDRNQTIAWLEKAYAQHSAELVSLKVNPSYDSIRSDPRFQDVVHRVGLAQ
jgi:predicted Zn-dependent protease